MRQILPPACQPSQQRAHGTCRAPVQRKILLPAARPCPEYARRASPPTHSTHVYAWSPHVSGSRICAEIPRTHIAPLGHSPRAALNSRISPSYMNLTITRLCDFPILNP